MKQKPLALIVMSLSFFACSILQPGPQEVPAQPPSSPATASPSLTSTPVPESTKAPVPSPSPVIKLIANDVLCPSENKDAQDFYNHAVDRSKSGDLAEAEKLYLKAIEADPGLCDAMDNLGQILRQQNRIDEAIGWYQKSLEVLPDNPVALQNMAVAYGLQGKTEKAREQYEKLTKVAPENPEGYFGLGTIYYNLAQPEKAIPYFETAEKLYIQNNSPYAADAQYYLGSSYFALQNCAETKKYLEPIYAGFSEDGGINYALGICYLTAEPIDKKAAREYLLKAQGLGVEIPADILNAINEK